MLETPQPSALTIPDRHHIMRPVLVTDMYALRQKLWLEKSVSACADKIRRIRAAHAQRRGLGIVVEGPTQSSLVGYGQIMRLSKRVEISDLIVATPNRSQGVGTAMIQHLIREMRHLCKIAAVEIGVAEHNPRAFALYRKLGFQPSYTLDIKLDGNCVLVHYLTLAIPL